MSNIRVELNDDGIQELLKSEWIEKICREEAEKIADRAAGSYEVKSYVGKTRVNVSISSTDEKTYRDNLKNNTLLKELL